MNSLILKDVIMLKGYARTLAIMVLFFAIVTYANDNSSYLSGMVILMLAMLPVTSFSYDQHAKWDLFSQTLPVTRKQLVVSKYVLGLIAIFVGVIVAILLNLIVFTLKKFPFTYEELLGANIAIALVGLLFLSILIPLVYKFGVEKSRLISLAVLAVPSLLVFGLSKIGVSFAWIDEISVSLIFVVSAVIVAFIYILSATISVKIYSKKDF